MHFGKINDALRRRPAANEGSPRRVCFVVTVAASALNFYGGYLTYLSENGWKVSLITSPGDGIEDFADAEGVQYFPVPMKRDPSPMEDFRSLVQLIRVLREIEPHVLVVATPKAGLLGVLAGFLTGVKVRLYQLWGLRLETEVGLRRRVLSVMERVTAGLATDLVANSPSLALRAAELRVDANKDIKVLGRGSSHGVDLEKYSGTADIGQVDAATLAFLEGRENKVTVGFIGRIHRDKGLDILLRASQICRERGIDIVVLILGRPEDESVKALVDRHVSGGNTHYVGRVADPRPYMRAMDIHCLPTLREGFPNVVLEASALGVPTITTTATGAIDSVVHEVTGLLVPPGDVYPLAASLQSLAADQSMRERFGAAAQRHVHENFEKNAVWSMNMELLNDLTSPTSH
ncbi:glycosyltransferase family 4 protein [Arthrobacter pigmenti]